MKFHYIYKIKNLCNNKIYIGYHKSNDKLDESYFGSGLLINRAINKYGINNFNKTIIEYVNEDNWQSKEKYWIKFYNAQDKNIGYNITAGGEGGDTISTNPNRTEIIRKITKHSIGENNGMYGKTHSNESKEKMSKHNYGHFIKNKSYVELYGEDKANEFKNKISNSLKDRSYVDLHGLDKAKELKENISKRLKAKSYEERYGDEKAIEIKKKQSDHIVSNETKKKMSQAAKGKTWEERYGKEVAQRMKLQRKLKSKK